jgi:D-apionolactonase
MPTRFELYGTDEAEAAPRTCAIGALSFEFTDGEVRTICFGGIEVLRGIAYRVRDRDWGTLAPELSDLTIVENPDSLHIRWRAACRNPEGQRIAYRATIRATVATFDFVVEAEAHDDFTTNRAGFCILHPADLAGLPLTVTHGDGRIEESLFPVLIDPWQPFTDIFALAHVQGANTIDCRLEGATFEMEDQRNWSDASFKTYARPLALPWPYVMPRGTHDRQAVSLRISGPPSAPVPASGPVGVEIGEAFGTMPRIGVAITPDDARSSAASRETLVALGVQDLLLGFDASAGQGEAELTALAQVAGRSGARRTLECVIAADDGLDAELRRIAGQVRAAGLALDAIAVFPKPDLQSTPPGSAWPDCPPLEEVYAAARRAFPDLPLGGGMFSYFTELNRKRVPAAPLDFISHATCPIVHAADDRSVMASLGAIPHILRSARAIYPGTPYRLGPITIGMRQNPYGSRTMPNPERRRMPMAVADPRQNGRFAAAWTIGYAAATGEARLDTLTLGGLTGPLGAIGDVGRRPVFEAIRQLASLAGQPRRACMVSRPEEIAALCAGDGLLLANLTADPRSVRIADRAIALEGFEVRHVTLG